MKALDILQSYESEVALVFEFGGTTTDRLSTRRVAGPNIIDCVQPAFVFGSRLPVNFETGSFEPVEAACVVNMTNQQNIDYLLSRDWVDRPYRVLVGGLINKGLYNERQLAFSEYSELMIGNTVDIIPDEKKSVIALGSAQRKLDINFPPSKFKEENAEIKDDDRPYILGNPENITPYRVTTTIYEYHEDETFSDWDLTIDEVRNEKGNAITNGGFVANLNTATVANSTFVYDDKGRIKTGSNVKSVTMDVSSSYKTVAQIFRRLVELYTDITNFRIADVDYEIGLYLTGTTTLKQLIFSICVPLDLNVGVNRAGEFFCHDRPDPRTEAPKFSLRRDDLRSGSYKSSKYATRYGIHKVLYGRNYTVKNSEDLPEANRVKYGKQWRKVSQPSTLPKDSRSAFAKATETPLTKKEHAEVVAGKVNKIHARRRLAEFVVERYKLDIVSGDIGEIDHPKATFRYFEVLEVTVNPLRHSAKMTVLGYE